MFILKRNGRAIECGDATVLAEFENAVVRWNTERSGWDKDGNFLLIRELPDVTEYQPET